MGEYVTVDALCKTLYGDEFEKSPQSIKSKRDTVSRMCRDGTLDAIKAGKRWLIRLED